MQKKLQVFVSSTYEDLKVERQAAVEAILQARHIPAGMELFASGSQSQLEVIREWIDDSDIFMLILGGRYGSIDSQTKKSYTELEYDYALQKEKPLFAAVMTDSCRDEKIRAYGIGMTETVRSHEMAKFKSKVMTRICKFFDSPKDLQLTVFQSLSEYARRDDLHGWVRGSDIIDAKPLLAEIQELKTKNSALADIVSTYKSHANLPQIAQPSSIDPHLLAISHLKRSNDLMFMNSRFLHFARHDRDGIVQFKVDEQGTSIVVGSHKIDNCHNNREVEVWKHYFRELAKLGMLSAEQNQLGKIYYKMTHLGYKVAQALGH